MKLMFVPLSFSHGGVDFNSMYLSLGEKSFKRFTRVQPMSLGGFELPASQSNWFVYNFCTTMR